MKLTRYLASASAALALALMPGAASANQFFPTQTFDLNTGDLYQQGLWLGQRTLSTVNPPQVVEGNLTFAPGGIPASTGRMVRILDTGQDLSIPFTGGVITPADGNAYYLSALIQLENDSPAFGTADGDYILHFSNGQDTGADGNYSGTGFRARVFLGDAGDNRIRFGIQHGIDASGRTWSTVTAAPGDTVFLVARILEVAGENNDIADLYVFTTAAVPATEPGLPDATSVGNGTSTTNADVAAPIAQGGYGRVGIRQGSANAGPRPVLIDELRAGSTWESVITDSTSVSDWSLF